MFEKACKKLSDWKGSEFGDISISCNFTRGTISENDFRTKLKNITDRYSFDRGKLVIEITEELRARRDIDYTDLLDRIDTVLGQYRALL
jgi:EAL domain-containing protein (putative c-di-GMP-specific phosphodiesterase class I)